MALGLVVGGGVVTGCGARPRADAGPLTEGVVEAVVDGDTVDVRIGGQLERVRLLGVDAPETVARTVPIQCFGPEASAALGELLPPGSPVGIERDVAARDHYGRLLLYLYRPEDGLFINRWLVEAGFAEAVSYDPNHAHDLDLAVARRVAVADGNGLWGHCDGPDQPLD